MVTKHIVRDEKDREGKGKEEQDVNGGVFFFKKRQREKAVRKRIFVGDIFPPFLSLAAHEDNRACDRHHRK